MAALRLTYWLLLLILIPRPVMAQVDPLKAWSVLYKYAWRMLNAEEYESCRSLLLSNSFYPSDGVVSSPFESDKTYQAFFFPETDRFPEHIFITYAVVNDHHCKPLQTPACTPMDQAVFEGFDGDIKNMIPGQVVALEGCSEHNRLCFLHALMAGYQGLMKKNKKLTPQEIDMYETVQIRLSELRNRFGAYIYQHRSIPELQDSIDEHRLFYFRARSTPRDGLTIKEGGTDHNYVLISLAKSFITENGEERCLEFVIPVAKYDFVALQRLIDSAREFPGNPQSDASFMSFMQIYEREYQHECPEKSPYTAGMLGSGISCQASVPHDYFRSLVIKRTHVVCANMAEANEVLSSARIDLLLMDLNDIPYARMLYLAVPRDDGRVAIYSIQKRYDKSQFSDYLLQHPGSQQEQEMIVDIDVRQSFPIPKQG